MVRLTRVGTVTVSEAGASGSTSVNNSFICHLKLIYDVVTYRFFVGGREREMFMLLILLSLHKHTLYVLKNFHNFVNSVSPCSP